MRRKFLARPSTWRLLTVRSRDRRRTAPHGSRMPATVDRELGRRRRLRYVHRDRWSETDTLSFCRSCPLQSSEGDLPDCWLDAEVHRLQCVRKFFWKHAHVFFNFKVYLKLFLEVVRGPSSRTIVTKKAWGHFKVPRVSPVYVLQWYE